MEKVMTKRTVVRSVYLPPQVEVYAQGCCNLLVGSRFGGGAGNGDLDDVSGAKAIDLGVEFKFKDVWENDKTCE